MSGMMIADVCYSTHGGAGYATGSYWDGDAIVCGFCGYRIENPIPTGGTFVPKKGLFGKLCFLFGIGEWLDTYPDWITSKGAKS